MFYSAKVQNIALQGGDNYGKLTGLPNLRIVYN
jgi:hypothetical protein